VGQTSSPSTTLSMLLAHNAAQRWVIYPRMGPDETLAFLQYDSRQEEATMRQVFHSSIVDPGTSPDARRRCSIEVRLVAIYDRPTETEPERAARFVSLSLSLTHSPPPAVRFATCAENK